MPPLDNSSLPDDLVPIGGSAQPKSAAASLPDDLVPIGAQAAQPQLWTQQNPLLPKTQADIDNAPPGAWIKHPKTGELFVKPQPAPDVDQQTGQELDFSTLQPGPKPPTATRAFIHGAERGALPAAGGLVGMGAGAELGAGIGAVGGPIGAGVGALVGGLGGAYLGSEALSRLQEEALQHLPESAKSWIGQSKEEQAADVAAHPWAYEAGSLAPNLLAFSPGSAARTAEEGAGAVERLMTHPVAQRVLPAGLMAGQEAVSEKAQGEPLNPAEIAIAGGAGALMTRETGLGRRIIGIGATPVRGVLGRGVAPADTAPSQPTPGTTAAPPTTAEAEAAVARAATAATAGPAEPELAARAAADEAEIGSKEAAKATDEVARDLPFTAPAARAVSEAARATEETTAAVPEPAPAAPVGRAPEEPAAAAAAPPPEPRPAAPTLDELPVQPSEYRDAAARVSEKQRGDPAAIIREVEKMRAEGLVPTVVPEIAARRAPTMDTMPTPEAAIPPEGAPMVAVPPLAMRPEGARTVPEAAPAPLPAAASPILAPTSPEAAARPALPFRSIRGTAEPAFVPSTGAAVPTEYAIASARDLITSHHDDLSPNAEFPQALQPRSRERAETEAQLAGILNGDPRDPNARFRPELLGESPDAANGAPIVGEEGYVESGNARTMALRRAYEQNLPQAQEYRDYLAAQGYPIEGIPDPVLVRLNRSGLDMIGREQLARDLNVPPQATMSATDRAMADAQQIPPELLRLYAGGDLFSTANRPFWRGILERVAKPTELPSLTDPEGGLSPAGQTRLRNALLAKAYGDPDTVAALTEDADSNIKAIGGALTDAAPAWAQLRQAVAEGRVAQEYDLTSPLIEAVRLISYARQEGRNIAEFVKQRGLFGEGISPETESAIDWMLGSPDWTRKYGRVKIADTLANYANKLLRPRGVVDETMPPPIELARIAREEAHGAARDLFAEKMDEFGRPETVRAGSGRNRAENQGYPAAAARLAAPAGRAEGAEELAEGKPARPAALYEDRLDDLRNFAADRADRDPHGIARDYILARGAETGNEHVVAIDPLTDTFATVGTSNAVDRVAFPADWGAAKGRVTVYHNHPGGTPPSPDDLRTLWRNGIGQIVVATDRDLFAARLTPETQARSGSPKADNAMRLALERARGSIYDLLNPLVQNDKLDANAANAAFRDLINRALAHTGLVDYISTRDPGSLIGAPLARLAVLKAAESVRGSDAIREAFPFVQGARDGLHDRSAATVRPERAMAAISRAAEELGRTVPAGEAVPGGRNEVRAADIERPAGLAEEGRALPPSPEEVRRDLDRVQVTDERPLSQRLREWANEARQDAWMKFRVGYQDRFARVEQATQQAKAAGVDIPNNRSPIFSARWANNAAGVTKVALDHEQIRYNPDTGMPERIPGSKSYKAILQPLMDAGRATADLFNAWVVARRADRLRQEGRERNVDDDFIDKYRNADQTQPDGGAMFRAVDKDLQGYYDGLLDFLEATNALNPKLREQFPRGDYVPFFRALDEKITAPRGFAGQILRSPIRQLKGGTARINNIFENGVIATQAAYRIGLWNMERLNANDMLGKFGAVTPLGKAGRAELETSLADPELRQALTDSGVDPDSLPAAAKDAARGLWSALQSQKEGVIGFLRDGKPDYMQVDDKLLYRGLVSLGASRYEPLIHLLAAPARVLRRAVILDPSFPARHGLRMVTQGFEVEGTNPLAMMAAAGRQVRGPDPIALQLMAGGAVSGYPDLPEEVRRQVMAPDYQNSLIDTPLKAMRLIGHLSERAMQAADLGPRVATYEKTYRGEVQRGIAAGMSPEEAHNAAVPVASDAARNVLDFSTRGDSEIAHFLAATIPFVNARWQGIARSGAALLGPNRNAVLMRGALLTAATIALWNYNKDKPEWLALPDWDRQYASHFWIDGIHYRFPRNWELGALFQTIPEIILQYIHNGDMREMQNAAVAMVDNVFKVNPLTLTPALIRPLIDAYSNTNSYTGAPIINEAEKLRVIDDRYAPGTSPSMIAMTRAYNAVSPVPVAPATMEFLLRGYFGAWSAYIASAADSIGNAFGLEAPRATPRATDLPLVGSFARMTPEAQNRIETDYYQLRGQLDQVAQSLKDREKVGDIEGIRRLREAHPEFSPVMRHALDHIGLVLSRQRNMLHVREQNPAMSADAKRQAEDNFYSWRNTFMRQTVEPLLRRVQGLPPQS